MKLRIKGNSIRLRLGRTEVRQLATDGIVEEFTVFGPGTSQQCYYAILASPDRLGVVASFDGGRMVVHVPWSTARRWAATDDVGIHAVQTSIGGELVILIEKDFECTDAPPGELQEDAFSRTELNVRDAGAVACAPAASIERST